jgi:apolipoprotein N-acyltransferase
MKTPRWGLWAPYAFAALGGALWGLAFSETAWTVASWVALAPLFPLLAHRRAWRLGFVWGLAHWLVAIPWVVPTMTSFGGLPPWLAVVCLLLLSGYLACFPLAFAALGRRLWRAGPVTALAGLPALWVALEWLRTYLFGGFPWNLVGYAWVDVPGALPLSAWIGAYGVGFLVVAVNAAVARAVLTRRVTPVLTVALLASFVLAVGARWGAGEAAFLPQVPRTVELLQPNIANQAEYVPDVAWNDYRRLLERTRAACRPGTLVVWPESAAWPFQLDRDGLLRDDVARLTTESGEPGTGCALILNSLYAGGLAPTAPSTATPSEDPRYRNAAYLVSGGEVTARYDKRHLVPFGEYVPLSRVFVFLDKIARAAGDLEAGTEARLLPWRGEELGMAICFEVVFPAEVAELTRAGATALMSITNDGWYGDSAAPWQHLRAARFRAAENRRALLRAALSGVTAVIAPDGSLVASLGLFEEGTVTARLLGRTDLSPYGRRPWLVPLLCSLVAAALLAIAFRRKRGASSLLYSPPSPEALQETQNHDAFRRPPTHGRPLGAARQPPGVSLKKPTSKNS